MAMSPREDGPGGPGVGVVAGGLGHTGGNGSGVGSNNKAGVAGSTVSSPTTTSSAASVSSPAAAAAAARTRARSMVAATHVSPLASPPPPLPSAMSVAVLPAMSTATAVSAIDSAAAISRRVVSIDSVVDQPVFEEDNRAPCSVCGNKVERLVCGRCVRMRMGPNEIARQQIAELSSKVKATYTVNCREIHELMAQRDALLARKGDLAGIKEMLHRECSALKVQADQQRVSLQERRKKLALERTALKEVVRDFNRNKGVLINGERDELVKMERLFRRTWDSYWKKLLYHAELKPERDKMSIVGFLCDSSGNLFGMPPDQINILLGCISWLVNAIVVKFRLELPHQMLSMGSTTFIRKRYVVPNGLVLSPYNVDATQTPNSRVFGEIRPLYLDDDLQLLDALREGLGWLNYTVVYLGMLVGLEIPKSQVFRTLHNVNLIGRHPLVALSDPITTAMPVTEEECMPPMSMLPPPSEYHKEDEWEAVTPEDELDAKASVPNGDQQANSFLAGMWSGILRLQQ